jgi:hypothetical protein
LTNEFIKKNYENEEEINYDSIEIAKNLLIKFRTSDIAYLMNYGVFIIGNNINEIENKINKIIEDV